MIPSQHVRVHPHFISCYDPQEDVLIKNEINSSRHISTHHCFCFLVSNQGPNFAAVHQMFKSSLRICQHVPCDRSDPPMISMMVLCWTFLSVQPVEGRSECSRSLTGISPNLNRLHHSKVCVLPKEFLPFRISCTSSAVVLSLKKNIKTQIHCSFESAVRKSEIARNMKTNKYLY